MGWIVTKYLITAGLVVAVSEFAKRSDKLGALIAALPLVTVLTLIWLHVERQPAAKVANHAWYTFWYVLPTLPMFLAFPALLGRLGFWPALAGSAVLTAVCFVILALCVKRFGIVLL
jgi:small-conductance mechanosensitive channel